MNGNASEDTFACLDVQVKKLEGKKGEGYLFFPLEWLSLTVISFISPHQGDPALLYLKGDVDDMPPSPLQGNSFGANTSVAGEVVFNTGMVGYPEALTDPSYRGQILVLTYPLIGNYGVPDESVRNGDGLPTYFESNQIHIAGLIVSSYSWQHSHWAAQKSLSKWLTDNGVPAIYGIDTRALTKHLRERGSILGRIEVVSRIRWGNQ
jgi:hypothetical protein